ncbi:MAG: Hsp70 family protein, partial [Gemmatimonadetes bacterium]|nr:Hsp70 family protein [Gemmatimonadota bacterium]
MAAVIGIDLGTTNSEVAIIAGGTPQIVREGDDAMLPSCVGLDEMGQVIVGHQARNQYAVAPERTVLSIKRLMGSETKVPMGAEQYTPQEISAFILKVLKERASRSLGQPVSKAVITVPAYFTDAQRQATREAGDLAGLEVVRIINEPTAAALSYESSSEGHRKILVYDLGGGTFDVSVVSMEDGVVEVLASTGDNHLGGDDFDQVLLERLNVHLETELGLAAVRQNRLLQARLRRAAEGAKIELSHQPYVRVEEDHIASVNGEAVHLFCELSRADFERDLEEPLARTMQAVTSALNDADVRPNQLDRILLVGGSTRIPRIAQLLSERLGQEPHGGVDPDLCVALGAAVQAGIEMGQAVSAVLVDITPYTFGTSAMGELYGMPYAHQFIPLIRRNAKLPATRTEVFFTMFEDQQTVEIKVYQGEDPDALKNVEIGTFIFDDLNRQQDAHEQGILFTYSLDLDGLLKVHAVERATGREIHGTIEDAMGRSSEEELSASRKRVEALWGAEEAIPVEEADHVEGAEEMRDTLAR